MIDPYIMRGYSSAQVEGEALINIRWRDTCLGLALPHDWTRSNIGWRVWVPRLSIELANHTQQNDIRRAFFLSFRIGRFKLRIEWLRPGPETDIDAWSAKDLGFDLSVNLR